MPTGPKGEKRPADVNARAVMIAKIATGEEPHSAAGTATAPRGSFRTVADRVAKSYSTHV